MLSSAASQSSRPSAGCNTLEIDSVPVPSLRPHKLSGRPSSEAVAGEAVAEFLKPLDEAKLHKHLCALGDRLENAFKRDLMRAFNMHDRPPLVADQDSRHSAPAGRRTKQNRLVPTVANAALTSMDMPPMRTSGRLRPVNSDCTFNPQEGWVYKKVTTWRAPTRAGSNPDIRPASAASQVVTTRQPSEYITVDTGKGNSRGLRKTIGPGTPLSPEKKDYTLQTVTSLQESWSDGILREEENPSFEIGVGIVILLNAALLSIETDYTARHWGETRHWAFSYLTDFMCIVFTIELCVRSYMGGCKYMFGKLWIFNLFDAFMVAVQWLQLAEHVWTHFGYSIKVNSLIYDICHILRLFSMLRVVRLVRNHYHVKLLVNTMAGCIRPLMLMLLILLLCSFLFGIVLTQIVNNYAKNHPDAEDGRVELQEFFGSLDRAMISLYEAMTDGLHWHEVMDPLVKYCSPWLKLVFVIYIAFTALAFMNILQGLFLESAMRIASVEMKDVVVQSIANFFEQIDVDQSGFITSEEFEKMIDNDADLPFFLRTLDIRRPQAMELFCLLDTDESGQIDLMEFVDGCERLQGSAKAIEFAAFVSEWRTSTTTIEESIVRIEDRVTEFADSLSKFTKF